MFDRHTKPKRPTQEREGGKEEGKGGDEEKGYAGHKQCVPEEMGRVSETTLISLPYPPQPDTPTLTNCNA